MEEKNFQSMMHSGLNWALFIKNQIPTLDSFTADIQMFNEIFYYRYFGLILQSRHSI